MEGFLLQPSTKDNSEVVAAGSCSIKESKKFTKSKSECEKELIIEKELNPLLLKEIVNDKGAVLVTDLREL